MEKTKLSELILYVLNKCPNISEEDLNFLLYQIDFTSYLLRGESVTGSMYINS